MAKFFRIAGTTPKTEYKGIPEIAFGGLHSYILNCLLDNVPVGSSILDLGSGRGAWASRLTDNGYKVTACDLNSQSFQLSEIPCLSIDLNMEFAHNLESSQFDTITCIEVLEHLENPRNTLRQSNRLLKDRGKLLLSTPNASGLYSRIRFLFTGQFSGFSDEIYNSMGHIRPITYWEIEKMLEETGFRLLKYYFYDFTPFVPKTVGDIVKRISWIVRPLMSGVVGTSGLIILAEKI